MSPATSGSYTFKAAVNHNTITLSLNIMNKCRKVETFFLLKEKNPRLGIRD